MLEGICQNCGETVNPADEKDDEHGYSELLGSECGGLILITGNWELKK